MHTLSYGAASSSGESEKYFTDPVHGVFAVVESLNGGDDLLGKLLSVFNEVDRGSDQCLAQVKEVIQGMVPKFKGTDVVSLAVAVHRPGSDHLRWLRAGASGISLLRQGEVMPIAFPCIWNPQSLTGQEAALPAAGLGLGEDHWDEGTVRIGKGQIVLLHTSGFPLLGERLTTWLKHFDGQDWQTSASALVDSGSTVVILAPSEVLPNLEISI